jgi:hypothetical protein
LLVGYSFDLSFAGFMRFEFVLLIRTSMHNDKK